MSDTFPFHTKYGGNVPNAFIVQSEYYNNKSIHLSVYDALSGQQICVATTNVPGYRPEPGYVLIKDWSENEGVFNALFQAGVIGHIEGTVKAGYTQALLCKYLWKGK